jgi:hypothetical protein
MPDPGPPAIDACLSADHGAERRRQCFRRKPIPRRPLQPRPAQRSWLPEHAGEARNLARRGMEEGNRGNNKAGDCMTYQVRQHDSGAI